MTAAMATRRGASPSGGGPGVVGRWARSVGCAALLLSGACRPVAAELGVEALFSQGLAPVSLGATPPEERGVAACEGCHAGIVAEWRGSRHAAAWTNGIFQREFKPRPLDWCVHCHAPLAPAGVASVDTVAAEGVSCAVCHLREGEILAAARGDDSPHHTRVMGDYDSERLCAGCHQFNFPVVEANGEVKRYTDHPMQDTVAEFRAGPYAGLEQACWSCHGKFGHSLPGAHALGALQHAATLERCWEDRRQLRVTVTNSGAGHKLPSGDLHRHLILRVWRASEPARLWEAFIGRAFEPAPDAGKRVRLDTAILPLESRVWRVAVGELGGGRAEPVSIELRYIYTEDEIPTPQNDPGEPTSVVVHRVSTEGAALCP